MEIRFLPERSRAISSIALWNVSSQPMIGLMPRLFIVL